jgi:uncharacterized protein
MDEEFEFDMAKSAANHDKHGIDFVEAQGLWGVSATVRPLPHEGESRLLRVGRIDLKLWAAVFTIREGRVRLISVRRARRDEEVEYGRETGSVGGNDHEH